MHDNKVSDKVIWEGSITPDEETSFSQTNVPNQRQMMFCYKCNNVIPGDSKFCPCCNVELYTTCPKCGVKYSSQYQICSQCGTNREEYLRRQKREQERKAALEREERIRQEKLEREKQEKKREEELKMFVHKECERRRKETYVEENKDIMKTPEYMSAYSIITEAFDAFDKNCKHRFIATSILFIIGFILSCYSAENDIMESLGIAFALLGGPICMAFLIYMGSESQRKKFISQYVSNKNGYNKSLFTTDLLAMVNYQGKDRLVDCCIIKYREKYGLKINYKWHSLR